MQPNKTLLRIMPEVQQPIGTPVMWEDEENQIKDKVGFCGRQSCLKIYLD